MCKGKILLIDDDVQFSETMQDILEMEDYQVVCIADPGNVEGLIYDTIPDVILVDYCLKGIDGGHICKKLRAQAKTTYLPIILISAYPQEQLPLDHIPYTVFIPKPFDLWEFLSCLEELMMHR